MLSTEREGILVRATAGLLRLMERGRFVFPPSVARARERYRDTLDSVRAFVMENCHFDPDAWVDRAELYRRYKDWCHDGGRLFLANTNFNTNLGQAFGHRIVLRTRQGRPGWLGLALGPTAPDYEVDDGGWQGSNSDLHADVEAAGPGGVGDEGDEGDDFQILSNRVRACGEGEGVEDASPSSPPPASEATPPPIFDEADVDDGPSNGLSLANVLAAFPGARLVRDTGEQLIPARDIFPAPRTNGTANARSRPTGDD
jgi:phage/plasmid-associated DNA primase